MSDINPLVLQRSTQHFAHNKSLSLAQDLALHHLDPKAITEVSLKCYAYGYFPHFKSAIKTNLKSYIKQVLTSCTKLSIFKLVLNGFDVGNDYLAFIINILEASLDDSNSTLTVVWLHTNHLTGCTHEDFVRMLGLVQVAGRSLNREEISVQITHWVFEKNFTMGQMEKDILQFIESSQMSGLNFRKFRLELSSWFLNNNDAFTFLKSGLDNASLLQKLAITDPKAQELTQAYLLQTQTQTYEQVSLGISNNQRKVKQLSNRNLCEQVHFYRVKDFQDKIVRMVIGILNILKEVEDFTIDFRNWNPMFKLRDMGNVLQSKSGAKSEFSFIHKMSRLERSDLRDERMLRTNYLL